MSAPTHSTDVRAHRIKRKPPPVIDAAERYPSPDPLDPFAPLSVLRNRTTSGLQALPDPEAHETLNNLIEQGRSNAYSYSTATTQISTLVNTSITSPTALPNKRVGHYRPHSQIKLPNSTQMYPTIASPTSPQTDTSPLPHGWSLINQRRPSAAPHPVDPPAGSRTESDPSLPLLRARSDLKKDSHTSSSGVRFPRFLLPRKPAMLDSQQYASTSMTSTTIQSKVLDTKCVQEPSISSVASDISCDFSEAQSDTTLVNLTTGISMPLVNDGLMLGNSNQIQDASTQADNTKDNVEDGDRLCSSDTECATTVKIPPKKKQTRPRTAPDGTPKMPRTKRFFSTPVISSSSRQSVSSSSIVNISPLSPSLTFVQSSEDAYNFPRPAPRPSHPPLPDFKAFNSTNYNPPDQLLPSEWDLPTDDDISQAASLLVTAENGTRVPFGSLFATQRTIVIFIRHFWCPLCQDYMSVITSLIKPEILYALDKEKKREDIKLAIISNGGYKVIAKYRQIFGFPFSIYTDPSLKVYKALGMSRDRPNPRADSHQHFGSVNAGPEKPTVVSPSPPKNYEAQIPELGIRCGGYTKRGAMGGVATVVVRAFKVGMSVWDNGGDAKQLGGEFIFGPGLTCRFAHRMQTTRGHAPIEDVLRAAGISVAGPEYQAEPPSLDPPEERKEERKLDNSPPKHRRQESMATIPENTTARKGMDGGSRDLQRYPLSIMTVEEEARWMKERQHSIDRLQEKKNARRGISNQASNQRLDEDTTPLYNQDYQPPKATESGILITQLPGTTA